MNREERRNLSKQGVSQETIDKMEMLKKPCTIGETIQIARAAAEDVCAEVLTKYRRDTSGLIMAMTIQLEVMKELFIKRGLVTEEEFNDLYKSEAEALNEKQKQYIHDNMESANQEKNAPSTDMKVSEIEVITK